MSDIRKTVIVVIMLGLLLATWQAYASLPREWGVSAPETVWSDRGITGTVSGRVVTSLDQTKGVEGAYVALVDPVSMWREYANTTTDADGNYRFTKVNATYSSALFRGPDGNSASYKPETFQMYTIYVNYSSVEAYSSNFGVDTNISTTVIDPIVLNLGIPSLEPTPEPTEAPAATAAPTAAPATPVPSPTPAPASFPTGLLLGGAAIVIILAIVAVAAYLLYPRIRRKLKK